MEGSFLYLIRYFVARSSSPVVPDEAIKTIILFFCYIRLVAAVSIVPYPEQGEILAPGDRVQAVERFTPVGVDAGIVFIKMAEGRGWVPIKSGDVGA